MKVANSCTIFFLFPNVSALTNDQGEIYVVRGEKHS